MGSSSKDRSHKKKKKTILDEKELLSTPLSSAQTFLPVDSSDDSEIDDFLLPPNELSFNSTLNTNMSSHSSSSSDEISNEVIEKPSPKVIENIETPIPKKRKIVDISLSEKFAMSSDSDSDDDITSAQTLSKSFPNLLLPIVVSSKSNYPISSKDKLVIIQAPVCFDIAKLDSKVLSKDSSLEIEGKWNINGKYTKNKYDDFCILNSSSAVGQINGEISINRKLDILETIIPESESKSRVEMPKGLKVRSVTFGSDLPKSKKIKQESSPQQKKKKKKLKN